MSPGRLILGLGLVLFGVLALLDAAGGPDAGEVIGRWWPLILVALGAARLMADPAARVGSIVLIVIGAVLLVDSLDLVDGSVWTYVWPAALIVIGAIILLQRAGAAPPASDSSDISAVAILGSRTVASTASALAHGEVTAILGSVELDLTKATLAPGARLSATVVLGGLDIVVPVGWVVSLAGTPILGGWDDTTRRDAADPDAPRLTVRALLVLGGVEVRHAERWA